ncbi:MAG: hypothetical protein JWR05_427 [Mucilaginibacter sp.]|nr:hypothetical protein [Mucilaginibacter sp.]
MRISMYWFREAKFYHMLKIVPVVFFLFIIQVASAQIFVKGSVATEKKVPIGLVVVSVQQGSTILDNTVTDSSGHYQFKSIKKGVYKFLFRHIAYQDTAVSAILTNDTVINVQFKGIQMLSEVVIHAKKPIFEREIDRLRFNVGQTDLVFGNNIWDVIEKTPLVTVSADGGIKISGTTGAVVYINNKKKVLTGTALRDYLNSLPSDNLEAIEVITTPSSKYDAEGGAGIINIITKKNKEEGFIGNASLSTRQTAVNSQAGSLYLNEREGKWNIYSSVYMGNRSRKPESTKDIFYPPVASDRLIRRSVSSLNNFQILYPGTSLGIDHQIDPNHVVGLLFDYSGNWHKETRNANSRDFYQNADSLTSTDNRDKLSSQTYSLNLNYQGKLDSSGKTLSIDFDVVEYRSTNNSVSKTDALSLTNNDIIFNKDRFRTASPQQIGNHSLKVDFEWPVNKSTSLNFGVKMSFSGIDNTFLFENRVDENIWLEDHSKSNAFRYDENINSLYGTWNYKGGVHWAYLLGIRLENTNAKGWLDNTKVVDRNYTNVFPTAFLKYTNSKKKTYVLAVSSRITRPGYGDVNPFRTYTTDQTYFEGNPFLSPTKYYREELSHTIDGKAGSFTIQLSSSQTIGEIYALPFDSGDTIANKKVNYGNKYSYTNAINYYNQPLPWWRISAAILTGYVVSKGSYANNVSIDNKSIYLSLSTNQTFIISKKSKFYASLIANNTFPATIVNTRIGNRLETEIRLRKSIGAFNLTLSAQDLLKSNKDRYNIVLGDLRIRDNYYNDTRGIGLALSYNFGKQTVKDKRNRDTGSDDVKGRLM